MYNTLIKQTKLQTDSSQREKQSIIEQSLNISVLIIEHLTQESFTFKVLQGVMMTKGL
jgi:hypothetical protein